MRCSCDNGALRSAAGLTTLEMWSIVDTRPWQGFLHRPRGESRDFREQAVGLYAGVSTALSDEQGTLLGHSDGVCCDARCRGELECAFDATARTGADGHFVNAWCDLPAVVRAQQRKLRSGYGELHDTRFTRREVHAPIGREALAGDGGGDPRA